MSESVEEVVAIEVEIGIEIIEGVDGERRLLGKVLRPRGTRDFPPNTKITVRNNSTEKGRYSYRETDGETINYSIMPGVVVNHVTLVGAVIKNIGNVDLDITP